jgi:Ca-activated chloride channel family protein
MANKKSSGGWLVFLVLGLFVLVSIVMDMFDSSPDNTTATDTDVALDAADASLSPEEGAQASTSWPPLADGVLPAPDLTASNYYIVLDGSGSMRRSQCSGGSTKIRAALSALNRFVGSVPANANLGLAVFDDTDLSERVPLAVGNRDAFAAALRKVEAGQGTPLRSAIDIGFEKLTEQAQRQLGYGEYHLVVVTDGDPDPASEDPTDSVQAILEQSPVVLHTIGFCLGTDHVLNQPGRTLYMAADSPEQLDQGLASVLAEAPSFDPATFSE